MAKLLDKSDVHFGRISNWWAVLGPGGLLATAYSIVTANIPGISQFGWAVVVLSGIGCALATLLILSVCLIAWRYFKPLQRRDTARLQRALGTDTQNGNYEGAHAELLDFVVAHLLPACAARERLLECLIGALCPNAPVAELAVLGATRNYRVFDYRFGMEVLVGLSTSPPQFISFERMANSVADIEKGYKGFLAEANRLAQSGYIDPRNCEFLAQEWETWRKAHNRMVQAYEAIKRNPKMGVLFRPMRDSRWGGLIPPSTIGVPLPLLLQKTEQTKQ